MNFSFYMETSLCYLYNKSIMDKIVIKGASQHNLKHVDLELPRNQLIVISGVSGSGKSSLAFDTIFAEGQRRYVESLSAYARQFLGRLDKPEVDYIEGLSPAVSIEQKTTHKNPRSTVGTVTEIYDYYRLLFARIGIPHCPQCGREIHEQSVDQIVDIVLSYPEGTRLIVSAPVVMGRKGEFKKIFTDAADSGFVRVRVDGEVRLLSEEIELDKKQKHDIDIIVDRIVLSLEARHRTAESIETALSLTDGIVKVDFGNGEESRFFSQKSACVHCGISLPELQPRLFSFNNPYGACPECAGLGMTMDFAPELVVVRFFNEDPVRRTAAGNPKKIALRRQSAVEGIFYFPSPSLPRRIQRTVSRHHSRFAPPLLRTGAVCQCEVLVRTVYAQRSLFRLRRSSSAAGSVGGYRRRYEYSRNLPAVGGKIGGIF